MTSGSGALALSGERIIAVGLLTQRDVDLLGPAFTRLWPVEETPQFTGLIQAIDEADRELHRARDAQAAAGPVDALVPPEPRRRR